MLGLPAPVDVKSAAVRIRVRSEGRAAGAIPWIAIDDHRWRGRPKLDSLDIESCDLVLHVAHVDGLRLAHRSHYRHRASGSINNRVVVALGARQEMALGLILQVRLAVGAEKKA